MYFIAQQIKVPKETSNKMKFQRLHKQAKRKKCHPQQGLLLWKRNLHKEVVLKMAEIVI